MSRLFKREIAVTVWRESIPTDPTKYNPKVLGPTEQLEIRDLRVKFKCVRDFSKHPNSAEVEITNLSPESRALMQERPLKVQLAAGYDGQPRLIASGDVRFSMSKLEGVDWTTLVQIGDGARAYAHARVNASFGKNATYRQMLTEVSRALGLRLPSDLANNFDLDKKFVAGATLFGPARDELSRLLDPFGLAWSIQNGTLRILSDQGVNANTALPLGEEQGMIGTPEFGSPPKSGKPPHMTVKCLLYPELIPGDKIKLTSKAKSGFFKLVRVEHNGDTAGNEFTTTVEIKPL